MHWILEDGYTDSRPAFKITSPVTVGSDGKISWSVTIPDLRDRDGLSAPTHPEE